MAATIDTAHVEGSSVAALKQHLQHSQQLIRDPPPIPHVVKNFIPLQAIISSIVYYAHAELRNILETLPATSSDLMKKRRLLDFIVKIRVQFVKVYVLTKWTKVSTDISKAIDVVEWMNGQQHCFANLIKVLVQIEKSLGGAKLRNPDIETALEVFTAGRPAHASRGFAPLKKLAPTTILQTLYDLNILLSIRLALTEKLPPEFSHYQIANGRVTFFVENSYLVQLGIADDSVDARFFLIDFQFDFPGAHVPSPATRAKLETLANNLLPSKGLVHLFEMLLRFTQNYKLSMFYMELTELGRGLYSGLIAPKFYPDKSLVTVHYWLSPNPRNNAASRNMIEIGLQRQKKIGIRWHQEGRIVQDHGIEFGQTNISTEWLLQEIATLHVRQNIASVYAILCNYWGNSNKSNSTEKRTGQISSQQKPSTSSPKNTPDNTNYDSNASSDPSTSTTNSSSSTGNATANDLAILVSPEKLKIKLTDSRYTIYSIDRLSGRAILTNSTKIIGSVEAALNELSYKPSYGADLLIKLRHVSLQDEISTRAKSAGWIVKTNMPFSGDVVRNRLPSDTKLVFCMRQVNWPARWFLLVSIGSNSQPRWWISQLVMKEAVWHMLFSEEIIINRDNASHYDYRMFKDLSKFTVGYIQTEALCKELAMSNIKYKLLQSTPDSIHRSGSPVILINMHSLCEGSWAEDTIFLRLNDDQPGVTTAVIQGRAKQSLDIGSMSNGESGVKFDASTGIFTLNLTLPDSCTASPVFLSGKNPSRGAEPFRSEFVELLVGKFLQIERIVSYVNLLKSLSLELREASMNKITFEYGPSMLASIMLHLSSGSSDVAHSLSETAELKLHENSPHHFVEPFLQSMLNTDGLLSVVWALQTALPLYVALQEIMELEDPALSGNSGNNLLASVPVIITPHSIIDIQLYFPATQMRIQLKLIETNGRPLSVYVTECLQLGAQLSLSAPATAPPPMRSSLLTPMWTQQSDIPGVVPLIQGLACPIEQIGQVLRRIFEILVNQ